MHIHRLNLNLIVALNALLIEKNVTQAANRVNVSQPAMSGSLRRLREYFNDPLLEFDGHNRFKLTPRARQLAGPVQDLLGQLESTLSGKLDCDPSATKRDVHIAMSSYCAHVFGSRLIADLRRNAPNITCRIHDIAEDSINAVSNSDIDFCMTLAERSYWESESYDRDLVAVPTFSDAFVVAAASDNRNIQLPLTLDVIRELPLVEVRIFGEAISVAERTIARYDRPMNTAAIVFGYHTALAVASGSSMVTIVPALLAQALAKSLDLSWYKPEFSVPNICETLIWHKRNDGDPVNMLIRQRADAVAASLTPPASSSFPSIG